MQPAAKVSSLRSLQASSHASAAAHCYSNAAGESVQRTSNLAGRLLEGYFNFTVRGGAAVGGLYGIHAVYAASQRKSNPLGFGLMPVALIAGGVLGTILGPVSPFIIGAWVGVVRPLAARVLHAKSAADSGND